MDNGHQVATKCEAGHGFHDTLHIDIHLLGEHHGLKDAPKFDKFLSNAAISFSVFNWKRFKDTKGYCPADDEVSHSIYAHGVWEAWETLLFLQVLSTGDRNNLVLDFGSNIGWYSVLAGVMGYRVDAFDADHQINDLFRINMEQNRLIRYKLHESIIDDKSSKLAAYGDKEVEFMKVDIEGSEEYAYKMAKQLYKDKKVRYAIFEISPCFNDSYFELVPEIIAQGYTAYRIPNKGDDIEKYESDPLKMIKESFLIETSDWREYIKSFSQENFLFIRNDLI